MELGQVFGEGGGEGDERRRRRTRREQAVTPRALI